MQRGPRRRGPAPHQPADRHGHVDPDEGPLRPHLHPVAVVQQRRTDRHLFRYICDNGTYIARYDDLFTGKDEKVDLSGVAVSNNGIELQDREFISAIREGREPNSSFDQILPTMRTLDAIEEKLA